MSIYIYVNENVDVYVFVHVHGDVHMNVHVQDYAHVHIYVYEPLTATIFWWVDISKIVQFLLERVPFMGPMMSNYCSLWLVIQYGPVKNNELIVTFVWGAGGRKSNKRISCISYRNSLQF